MTDDNSMNMQRKLKLFRRIFGIGITSFHVGKAADLIGMDRRI